MISDDQYLIHRKILVFVDIGKIKIAIVAVLVFIEDVDQYLKARKPATPALIQTPSSMSVGTSIFITKFVE